jgi:hypothetical protein
MFVAPVGHGAEQAIDGAAQSFDSTLPAAAGTDPAATTTASLTDETVVLTVGPRVVRWSEYRFWLIYLGRYYKTVHHLNTITDWQAQQDGMGLRESLLKTATAYVCNATAIEAQASAVGIQLTPADLAEQAKIRADNIRIYGSYSEYLRIVGSMYGSEAQFQYLAKIDRLSSYLFAHLYGSEGEQCSDECIAGFIQSQGLAAVLYIFRSRTDSAGHELAPQRRRGDYSLLKHLHTRLQASQAPLKLFSKLIDKYSDDKSLADYPAGRIIAHDGKGAEFDLAVGSLADNAYTDVIATPEGYYLILRKPLSPDMAVDSSGTTLRYWAAYQSLFKAQISKWCAALPIQYADSYPHIDVEGLLR